jgi:hypothetical protein
MHPRPIAETDKPLRPSSRFCIVIPFAKPRVQTIPALRERLLVTIAPRFDKLNRIFTVSDQCVCEALPCIATTNARDSVAKTPPAGASFIDDALPWVEQMNSFRAENEHFPMWPTPACRPSCKLARNVSISSWKRARAYEPNSRE